MTHKGEISHRLSAAFGTQGRAAAYARMSTEGQQYSIANQLAAIREYADAHGLTVVRTYTDEGKSGLQLQGRRALTQLLTDVLNGQIDFEIILVYDVSRWGRFQDTDESAYYEFLCRRANLRIEYCAEPFRNDGGALAAILKNIKRVMAAEYSREQSNRVHRAAMRIASMGFRAGGSVPYGYRRLLIGTDGKPRSILAPGERKAVSAEHVVLVPGLKQEAKTVRRVFRLYTRQHLTPAAIADRLNREGRPNSRGRRWNGDAISRMTQNEVYVGTLLYNRVATKLKARRRRNDRENWVRVERAHPPLVSPSLFAAAQAERVDRRHRVHSDEELLDHLRSLYRREQHLSYEIICSDKGGAHVSIYRRRFGGLRQAYARVGLANQPKRINAEFDRHVASIRRNVISQLVQGITARGGAVKPRRHRNGSITINSKLTVAVFVARFLPTLARGEPRWRVGTKRKPQTRLALIVRLDKRNEAVLDYFLVPMASLRASKTELHLSRLRALREYRSSDLRAVVSRLMTKTRSETRAWSGAKSRWSVPRLKERQTRKRRQRRTHG